MTINATPKNAHEIEVLKLKIQHFEEKLKIAQKENEYLREQTEKWQKQADQLLLQFHQNDKNEIKELVSDELINIFIDK